MELLIDTTDKNFLILALRAKGKVVASKKIKTHFNQSEKLWPALDKLLKANKIKTANLKKIIVTNGQGSFTSLRIGVTAANALAFAWGLKVEDEQGHFKPSGRLRIVEPVYDRGPNITSSYASPYVKTTGDKKASPFAEATEDKSEDKKAMENK
jgi:hypothetical protein